MFQSIINYAAFALIIQSLIVCAEIFINFKRPLSLKAMILVIVLCATWRASGVLYANYYGYNRWLVELPSSIAVAATISFFSIIYQNKLRTYVIIFGIAMVLTQLVFIIYFSFVAPVNDSINPKESTIILLGRLLRLFFTAGALFIMMQTCYRIVIKYRSNNLYFKKLRYWSLAIILIVLLVCINSFLKTASFVSNQTFTFIFLIGNFSLMLLFMFRPKFLNRSNLKITLGDFFVRKRYYGVPEKLFVELFFTNLYYLQKDASVEDFKKRLNVSAEVLNAFLHEKYGTGLPDFINKNRVAYFIDLIQSGKYGNYTVDALAHEAGFGSRFHLYKSFKKFHGGTPSDFMRSVV